MSLIRRCDGYGRLRFIPFQDQAGLGKLRVPRVPRAPLATAMHLVSPDRRVWAGAAAARPLLRLLPGGRLLAWIFGMPAFMPLAAAAYGWIAARRHRLGCASARCRDGIDRRGAAG